MPTPLRRRALLGALGIGSAGILLNDLYRPALATAGEEAELPLLVFAYFEGGWDTLLCLDPRNGQSSGAIQPAYAQLAQQDAILADVLAATGGTGLVQPPGSNIAFGPAVGSLADHFADLCIVRGIDMGTLTHEVGRRYFITGKFPRGVQATGSALPTRWVHGTADRTYLPNLVVGGESYNDGLDPKATGVVVRRPDDLFYLLNAIEPDLAPGAASAIDAWHARGGCLDEQLDSSGLVTLFRESRMKAASLRSGELYGHFDFDAQPPSGEIAALLDAFGYLEQTAARPIYARAMLAAQALKYGISQAVSIDLAEGLDTHDDTYQTYHAPALRAGFDAAARLIAFLKDPQNGTDGRPLWDRTVLVLWSEFARTPLLNDRGGRDHHLWSSCLVAGKGIRGNTVVGATNDTSYSGEPVDLATGARDAAGVLVRPVDVHATVLEAMGLGAEHLANQDPRIVSAMLHS